MNNFHKLLFVLGMIWLPSALSLPQPFSSVMTGAWHRYLGFPLRREDLGFPLRREEEVKKKQRSLILSHLHRSEFPMKQFEFGQRSRNRLWHNFSTLGGRHP